MDVSSGSAVEPDGKLIVVDAGRGSAPGDRIDPEDGTQALLAEGRGLRQPTAVTVIPKLRAVTLVGPGRARPTTAS